AATAVVLATPAPGRVAGSSAAAATPSAAAAPDGKALFQLKGCIGCHNAPGLRSPTGFAPDLAAIAAIAPTRRAGLSAEAYVRESIRQPQAYVVPGFGQDEMVMPTLPVDDAELDALVAFLLTPQR
ncbi:MAG: cytochrome c, partial [Chloroflexota bacterium]|nr:cytochrome c [Chloroflexota bacterium]